jgi:iron complex outermembrane recepter protein
MITKALSCAGASAIVLGCCLATAAQAQQAESPAAGQQAQSDAAVSDASNGEIIVTAQKRSESINRVGLTVTAFGGDTLKQRGINDVQDLALAVPGFSFTPSSSGTPVYTLRGVGFYETSLAAYPTVSVYLDEVPLPFPALTRHTSFDVERVEVLKGPQGTLFGENATGGAINYIAAKPTKDLHYGGSVSYGRFNSVIGDAFISGPISDVITARISGRVEHADGWQKSVSRPDDRNG